MTRFVREARLHRAVHDLFPRWFAERAEDIARWGAAGDPHPFAEMWRRAGIAFVPRVLHVPDPSPAITVLTCPPPRAERHVHLIALAQSRYFVVEHQLVFAIQGAGVIAQRPASWIGEWAESRYTSHGPGPAFDGEVGDAIAQSVSRIRAAIGRRTGMSPTLPLATRSP